MKLRLHNCDALSPMGWGWGWRWSNEFTLNCNQIWPITLAKCKSTYRFSNPVTYTIVVDIAWLRWRSNQWFQSIRIFDTYFNRAKYNGNAISNSGSKYFVLLHFHCICPITFKNIYTCYNLSGFTARSYVICVCQTMSFGVTTTVTRRCWSYYVDALNSWYNF